MRLWRRLTFWLNRRRMADELREEMETHRAFREAALRRDGVSDESTASRRALGNVTLAHDDVRDVWIWPRFDSLVRDVLYAARLLRRRPGFAAACIITIAVGTGALASVLSVVHIVLLSPPPYPNHDRLVQIGQVVKGRVFDEVSPPDVRALRDRHGAIEDVTTAWTSNVSLTGGDLPERARMVYTDSHAFSMLGTSPLVGRLPSREDEAPGAPPVVVLGYAIWQREFAGDRNVVNKRIRIDGKAFSVLGVMPPEFKFPAPYWSPGDLWLMRGAADTSWPDSRDPIMLAFGLIRSGHTLEAAQRDADVTGSAVDKAYPASGAIGLRLMPYAGTVRDSEQPRLLMILGAAALVLIIVCVNVVNLSLGRTVDRHRELAARAALGAGRGRLIRQLMTETLFLFTVGGLGGVLIGMWGSRAMVALRSYSIPRMEEAVLSWPVALMTMGVVWSIAVIVGVIIAIQATTAGRLGLDAAGARGASHSRRGRRIQRSLVGAEIAIALVLLCGAGVLVEGAWLQARVTPGFETAGLLHARLNVARDKYTTFASQRAYLDRQVDALKAIPGVYEAAAVDVPPGVGGSNARAVLLDTDPIPANARELRQANVRIASASYFATLALSPRAGRFFTAADHESTPVAIVNEAFVARHLDGAPAVGRQIRVVVPGQTAGTAPLRTIVGVYPDVKEKTIFEATPPTVFLPMDARDATRMALLVRTDRSPAQIQTEMRKALARVDPDQAMYGFMGLGELMNSELSMNKLSLILLGTLGGVALLLATVGVYAVTSAAVRQRTREIAIRLALGVTPAAVKRLLIRECGHLLVISTVVGGIAGIWSAGVLRSLVDGIPQTSPATFAAAGAVLAIVVLIGCYAPARRAARVDPATVLRGD